MSVRPVQKRARPHRLSVRLIVPPGEIGELNCESVLAAGEACRFKDKETAGEACRVAQPRAERSEGRRLSAAKEHESCAKRFRFRSRPSFMWCSRFPVHTGHRFLCCVFVFCVAVETAD